VHEFHTKIPTLSIARSRREMCNGSFGAQLSQQLHIERKTVFHIEKKEMRFNKASSNVLEKNIPLNNAGQLLTKVIIFFYFFRLCAFIPVTEVSRSKALTKSDYAFIYT
jgi:hypothetical protein